MQKLLTTIFLAGVLLMLGYAPSHAQATRTWVSGVGDDANPCSRTAPCKTFAGAISKTAAAGEISVLDPGGFGAVTITKSMSIVSEGSEGSILATGTNGININAGPQDIVNLHGLFIEGAGTGINGINIISAKSVHIRKTLIRGFRGSGGSGIVIAPSAGITNVYVNDSTITENARGIAMSLPGPVVGNVVLDRVIVSRNVNSGIVAGGANSNFWLTNTVVTGNANGINVGTNAKVVSFVNNVIVNNASDGAPTSTLPLQ